MIRITALGPLRVEKDGVVLDRLPARRLRLALLLYLGVEREATREHLMGVFWGDRPPERARHLLSQTLYELRQDLGEAWMTTAGEQVAATAELVVDAEEFAAAVEADRFDEALEIYDGAFLAGATLGVSREFEGWVDRQEARIGRLHRRARRGAIDGLVEARRFEEALARARDWVELDPLDDEAQHRLVELMAATGDRSGALRQYDRYAALVASQLELEPLDETQALVARIRQGEVGERGAAPARAEDAAPPEGAPSAPESASSAAPPADAAAPATDAADRRDAPAAPVAAGVSWLRQHSMVRWTVTYLAGAVVALEGTSTVAGAFDWSPMVVRALAVALALGALGVMATAWTHSSRGRRFGVAEVALVGVVTLFGAWVVSDLRSPATAAETEAEPTLNPRRIAVLYFDDLSAEQDLGPISAGFTEALIHELGQADGLEILSRSAVQPYRYDKPTLDSIIRDLRAGTLVEGSLARLGDSLRVMFHLIDGASRTSQLSGTIDRPVAEVHTIVRDLPKLVALRLRERLGEEVRLREARNSANSAEAWTLVQRAQVLTENEGALMTEDLKTAEMLLERADSLLRRAEALDPEWLEPTVQRARIGGLRAKLRPTVPGTSDPELAWVAIGHADRALARSPEHTPALEQRGLLYFDLAESPNVGTAGDVERLYQQAEADLRAAVELDPQAARAWWSLSRLLRRKNSRAEAKQAARRALAADAFLQISADALWQLFDTSFTLEELEEAEEWCRALHDRHPRNMRWVQCELGLLASSTAVEPQPDRAWALVDTVVALGAEADSVINRRWAMLYVAKTLIRAGEADSARAIMRRVAPDTPPGWALYDLAHAELMLGDETRALELLELRAEANPGRSRSLANDWWFRALHGDPRLERIIGTAVEEGG